MKQAKGAKGACDRLVSRIVRARGNCERCGAVDALQCCHIISRKYSSTRVDLDNLVCMCASCHFWSHSDPVGFSRWLDTVRPAGWYEALNAKAQKVTKVDWDKELVKLKQIAKERGI